MKRIVMAMATGALLLASCGGGNSVEATVNDQEITTDDVKGVVFEFTETDEDPALFATYLSLLIQWAAIDQRTSSELEFEPTDEEIDTQVRTLAISAGFTDLETILVQQNIAESTLRRIAKGILIEEHLHQSFVADVEPATLEEAEQALADAPNDWVSEVCASHILVGSFDEAAVAMSRLQAGEDFAAVAAELSLDTSNAADGGSLGCADPEATYVPEFAEATIAAPLGEVAGPVTTEFGTHLILVESREPGTAEQVQLALTTERQTAADDDAFLKVLDWLNDAVVGALVVVDESRGTWVTEPTPQLLPPASLE
jgi:parvulin-like peptidyl-prolyl isomerase